MAVNKRLLQGAAGAGEFVPSEHFGVVTYEGDGSSSHSINGGKFGAGAYFNGSSSKVDIGTLGTTFENNFSFSLWFNLSTIPSLGIVTLFTTFEDYYCYAFIRDSDKKVEVRVENASTGYAIKSTSTFGTYGVWHHLAVTKSSSDGLKIYINGSLENTDATATVDLKTMNGDNLIGAYNSAGTTQYYLEGKIDQVRIFTKALSSSEVSTLYAETLATPESLDPLSEDTTDTLQVLGDSSCVATYRFENDEVDLSGNYNGTGTEIQYAAGRYGQAASFNDTSSSKIVIGAQNSVIPNNTTGVSFSFWVYLDSVDTGSNYDHWFVGQENYGGGFEDGEFSVRLYEGKVYTDYAQSGSIYRQRKATTVLSTGQWYHIVATYDTSNANITEVYLNGSLETSSNLTSGGTFTTTALMQNSTNISIGGSDNGYTDGKIDQFRIFTKVLSASEVTTLYNENSLVASYRFEGNANDDTRNYDGSPTNVTYEYGLNFTPDFVWIKQRDAVRGQNWFDSTRGVYNLLQSNNTNANTVDSTQLTSFDAGGFTVGSANGVNASGGDFVAWCLKANGGTTSSNTDGTITSTVQANQEAGFSIVSYSGTGSAGNVGHSLGVKPDLIICKNRNSNGVPRWVVYDSVTTAANKMYLDDTSASSSTGNWGNTEPTSSVFSIGTSTGTNASGGNYITYCFASKEGFSKIGSYTGNGSTNGPIVETGFEPAFLLVKQTNDISNWVIVDNKRSTTNPRDKGLRPNTSDSESTVSNNLVVDFLSNGFQLKQTSGSNANNGNFIYMAFAADPDTEAPTVAKSFNIATFTPTTSSNPLPVTGFGFQPSFVWAKYRDGAQSHYLVDSVRGLSSLNYSDRTDAAYTASSYVQSFDSDGITYVNNLFNRTAADSVVAWAWKADDNEPTINTEGSIDSLVSANANAGFSIVKWTGTGAINTVGHGLSAAPEMILIKDLDTASDWQVYHTSIGNGNKLTLNTTAAASSTTRWDSTSPTATVFTLRDIGLEGELIAYCFHSVAGYSKFGSYTGIASGNVTVTTGFQPDFVMVKCVSHGGTHWEMHDSIRVFGSTGAYRLRANDSSADAGFNDTPIKYTSTGFYLDSSVTANNYGDYDANGRTYIYMAFKMN